MHFYLSLQFLHALQMNLSFIYAKKVKILQKKYFEFRKHSNCIPRFQNTSTLKVIFDLYVKKVKQLCLMLFILAFEIKNKGISREENSLHFCFVFVTVLIWYLPMGDILHPADTSLQFVLLTLLFCRCEWKQVLRVIHHS